MLRTNLWVIITILLISTGVVWYANTLGLWYVTCLVGLLLTGLPIRTFPALLLSTCVSCAGWGLPLLWLGRTEHLHDAASVVSATMGFGTQLWWTVDLITIITGVLLGISGTWFGKSAWALIHPARHSVVTETGGPSFIATSDE